MAYRAIANDYLSRSPVMLLFQRFLNTQHDTATSMPRTLGGLQTALIHQQVLCVRRV